MDRLRRFGPHPWLGVMLVCVMALPAREIDGQTLSAVGASAGVFGFVCGTGPGAAVHGAGATLDLKLWAAHVPPCDSPVGGLDATVPLGRTPLQVGGALAFSESEVGAGVAFGLALRRDWIRSDALLRYLLTESGVAPIWSVEFGFRRTRP